MPQRIQRKRTKGWTMPENSVYVGRPTKWGNPLKLLGDDIYIYAGYRRKKMDKWVYLWGGDIDDVLFLFRHIVQGCSFSDKDLQYWSDKFKENDLMELKGKDLACFCPLTSDCHADVLIQLANK